MDSNPELSLPLKKTLGVWSASNAEVRHSVRLSTQFGDDDNFQVDWRVRYHRFTVMFDNFRNVWTETELVSLINYACQRRPRSPCSKVF